MLWQLIQERSADLTSVTLCVAGYAQSRHKLGHTDPVQCQPIIF